jgi:hypothetical protein
MYSPVFGSGIYGAAQTDRWADQSQFKCGGPVCLRPADVIDDDHEIEFERFKNL